MNYGLDLEKEKLDQSEEDYIFGAESPKCIALIPRQERKNYLPKGEVQRGKEDFQDCTARSPINELEAKFTFLLEHGPLTKEQETFLRKNKYVRNSRVEFSDRFIAIKSGTGPTGNSLKAPLDAMHRHGLIPKSLFPSDRSLTWAEYHDASQITPRMEALGKEFLIHFSIYYERVFRPDFDAVIEEDMIGIAGYAWPKPVNGEYPRVENDFTHAFLYYDTPRYYIFDNYIDSVDGDYIKKLAPDYRLMDYGYRVYIGPGVESQIKKLQIRVIELCKMLIKSLIK